MRLASVVVVGLAVAASGGALVAPPGAEALHLGLAVAQGLTAASTWTERYLSLAPALGPLPAPGPFEEARPVSALVGSVYERLGVALAMHEAQAMDERAAALDGRVAWALQQLLGAVDAAMADWEAATAAWDAADLAVLAGHHEPSAERTAIAAKADRALLQGAVLRTLGVLDRVVPVLQEARGEPGVQGAVFPGPNEGVLFNDPFNLILVGDVGPSVYWRNTFPFSSIDPWEHILILELGGDDAYHNHAATAHALPGAGVCLQFCNNGVYVSLLVDIAGDDVYAPQAVSPQAGGSTAMAKGGGQAVLLEVAGNDRYLANEQASHGFGADGGTGLLLDASGDDAYVSLTTSTGRGVGYGQGILLDLSGSDSYAGRAFTQGSAHSLARGILADLGGDDTFSALDLAQGHGSDGLGLFLNVGGADAYTALSKARGYSDTCWTPAISAACFTSLHDHAGVFLDLCGTATDKYFGAVPGADGTTWEQNDFGFGFDVNAPVLSCAAYE